MTVFEKNLTSLSREELGELRTKIGFLFQSGALYDSMTVGENVAFPMVQHTDWNAAEIERRVSEKLGQVGLAGVEPLEPSELSGGMQRRAALARSLALDPQIIIYDEPTAGLSPLYVDMFFDKIREIHETRGVAIILAEQNATKALQVADRVMVLSLGEAYAVVDAAELTTQQLKEGYRI